MTESQKFKLEQVSSTGGYLIRAMCSSNGANRVVDIQRVGTEDFVKSGNNAYLYTATAPKTQQWFIVGVGVNEFKIVLRSNMNLALTVYGNSDGTSSGNTSTSAGNVFLSTYDDSTYQRWEVIDENGFPVATDNGYFNGVYYINDSASGKFVQQKANLLGGISGLVNYLGSSIKWKITPAERKDSEQYYFIQPVSDVSLFLMSASLLASEPCLGSISSSNIPDNCKWVIDGWGIRNVASEKYLRFNKDSSGVYSGKLSVDRNTDSQWRIVKIDTYNSRELREGFGFKQLNMEVGQSKTPVITSIPENAFWTSFSDFEYRVVSELPQNCIILDDGKAFKAINAGNVIILATHRVTGNSCKFLVQSTNKDPFASSNIENITIRKYDQTKWGGDSDITTVVTTFSDDTSSYFEMYSPGKDQISFYVDDVLISSLLEQESNYQAYPTIGVFSNFYFHLAKLCVDDMVKDKLIDDKSPEYYGIWASEANRLLILKGQVSSVIDVVVAVGTAVYNTYRLVTAIKAIRLATNSTQIITSSMYKASAEQIDGMFDELTQNNVKYSRDKIIWITRDTTGKVRWLEVGTENSSGFAHILMRHSSDFKDAFGLNTNEKISVFILNLIQYESPVQILSEGQYVYTVGTHNVSIIIGSNGYIVSAYPGV